MARQHLADTTREFPLPPATADVMRVLESGIQKMNAAKRVAREADRGTLLKLNPSISDAGKCQRQVVYSLMNVRESDPPTIDSEMRFIVGHAFEDAVARILSAHQGATILREERIEIPAGETKVTGRSDFGSVLVRSGEGETWELKSTNSAAVGFMLKRNEPNEHHVHQLNLYLFGKGEKRGRLVYLVAGAKKGEPCAAAWDVDCNEEMAAHDLAALAEADALAKKNELPPRPAEFKRNTFPCGYCPHQTTCWNAQ